MSKNTLPKKPLTKKRLKNLILNVVRNPFNMIVLVSLIVLFCLIVIPLLTMVKSPLPWPSPSCGVWMARWAISLYTIGNTCWPAS